MNSAYLIDTTAGQNIRYDLYLPQTTIGRGEKADIQIKHSAISRLHTSITHPDDYYYIQDMGSHNGTFVKGEPVGKDPVLLKHGVEIVLGGFVTLQFFDELSTETYAVAIGRVSGVWISSQDHGVWVDGVKIDPPLSGQHHILLTLLYQHEGEIVSRDDIVRQVWKSEPEFITADAVNKTINRLSERIEAVSPGKVYIEVLRGHGIRLKSPR